MRVVAIIQARLASTRLPRKALADLAGRPLLAHVVERARAIDGVGLVALNIPHHDVELLPFANTADRDLSPCVAFPIEGQEQDVLGSYRRIADEEGADIIMRLTGDCPLLAPELCELVLLRFMSSRKLYGSNVGTVAGECTYTHWADGWDCEVFTREALELAHQHSRPEDRSHVTPWLRRERAWQCEYLPAPRDYSALKCSVDTAEDLARVRAILAQVPAGYTADATWRAWERAGRP